MFQLSIVFRKCARNLLRKSVFLSTSFRTMTSSNRFIVDCDVGLDDAQALIMALARNDVTIEAITSVGGNTDVTSATKNVRKVLALCNKASIPTYKGCSEPFIVKDCDNFVAYHGVDGLGDVTDNDVISDDVIQPQHAVNFLIEKAAREPNALNLVCLGPLTNIAAALKLDPDFGGNLKACYIMGGNYHGRGNVTTAAEFNFHFDPEAAYIALRSLTCPIVLTGWEACLDHPITWQTHEKLHDGPGRARTFIRVREAKGIEWMKQQFHDYVYADQLTMATALDRTVIKKSFPALATVELHGAMTRGQMVVDRKSKNPNVEIVVDLHMDRIIAMMTEALDVFD